MMARKESARILAGFGWDFMGYSCVRIASHTAFTPSIFRHSESRDNPVSGFLCSTSLAITLLLPSKDSVYAFRRIHRTIELNYRQALSGLGRIDHAVDERKRVVVTSVSYALGSRQWDDVATGVATVRENNCKWGGGLREQMLRLHLTKGNT